MQFKLFQRKNRVTWTTFQKMHEITLISSKRTQQTKKKSLSMKIDENIGQSSADVTATVSTAACSAKIDCALQKWVCFCRNARWWKETMEIVTPCLWLLRMNNGNGRAAQIILLSLPFYGHKCGRIGKFGKERRGANRHEQKTQS
jgi:hypothetical protein